jgi:hypothetical protein
MWDGVWAYTYYKERKSHLHCEPLYHICQRLSVRGDAFVTLFVTFRGRTLSTLETNDVLCIRYLK